MLVRGLLLAASFGDLMPSCRCQKEEELCNGFTVSLRKREFLVVPGRLQQKCLRFPGATVGGKFKSQVIVEEASDATAAPVATFATASVLWRWQRILASTFIFG